MFEGLSVDEIATDDSFQDDNLPENPVIPEVCSTPDVSCKAEEPTDRLEVCVAFLCLLRDLQQMRKTISDCWLDYRKGAVDLVTAALTSNTALELARHMEEDLHNFTSYGGAESLLKTQHAMHCRCLKELPEYQNLSDSDFDSATYDATVESSFWSAYQHLKDYLEQTKDRATGTSPLIEQDGVYDARADRSRMTGREKTMEDRQLLRAFFTNLSLRSQSADNHVHDDELIRGFIELHSSGIADSIPLWLVFATQIFLDIHHTLRERVTRGFDLLSGASYAIISSIDEQFEHQAESKEPIPPWADELRALQVITLTFCNESILEEFRPPTGSWYDAVIEGHKMLKMHPISCGIRLYAVKSTYRSLALDFVSGYSSIIACAHLNNALIREGFLRERWMDMDLLHLVQDEPNMYAGGAPKASEQYHKRFCLAVLGFSTTNYARNRRRPQDIVASNSRGRLLESQTPVADAFRRRYCLNQKKKNLAAQDLQKILEVNKDMFIEETHEGDEKLKCDMIIRRARPGEQKTSRRAAFRSDRKIDSLALLRNLRTSLTAECLELSFDYLRMHRICTELLVSIRDSVLHRMIEVYGSMPRQEFFLRMVVFFILGTLATEQGSKSVGLPPRKTGYRGIGREMMQAAADKIKELMTTKYEGLKNFQGHDLTHGETVVQQTRYILGFNFYVDAVEVDAGL